MTIKHVCFSSPQCHPRLLRAFKLAWRGFDLSHCATPHKNLKALLLRGLRMWRVNYLCPRQSLARSQHALRFLFFGRVAEGVCRGGVLPMCEEAFS